MHSNANKSFSKKIVATILFLWLMNNNLHGQRSHGGFYTVEKLNNLRTNCSNYDWAKMQQEAAVAAAHLWVQKTDEELWQSIPGQLLPRCIDVTFDRLTTGPKFLGCLNCGNKIAAYGSYPYQPDIINKPWKLTCPSCNIVFPTNDFKKYYLSGIDEHGLFDSAKADKKLLYNEQHPNPDDPLHKYGVDNGYGYIDSNGRAHRYIGYYTWKYWDHLINGLAALADAYIFTGEQLYAHKAAVMLDRIADVYPSMDWKPYADKGWYHSDGGSNKGKIGGSIWETTIAQRFADNYDKILSGTVADDSLFSFLHQQSLKYKLPAEKGTRKLFVQHIDDHILKTIFSAVLSEQIRGNQGMHQLAVARSAIALNSQPETTKWLDWLFEPLGGAIPGLMVSRLDRDGASDEGAPGYAFIWATLMAELGELLRNYEGYNKHDLFNEFPQLRACFTGAYRMAVLGKAIPNIGDAGATGLVSAKLCNPQFIANGYSYYKDSAMAIAAYRANGLSIKNLGYQIFSKDPEAINNEIEKIAAPAGARPLQGYLMNGFGLALLETGTKKNGMALACNFGRSIYHAHPDILNFDLFAFDHWLAPDHGYPEFATQWPSNQEWTGTTVSHNLVVVNQHPQKEVWGGFTRLFKQLKGFGVFEIDGKAAYPGITEYSRTMMLIGSDETAAGNNAYIVDIFRVQGGNDHLYSFHGPPGIVTSNVLQFSKQKEGTYAGETILKGTLAKNFPVGYSHLYNVQRNLNLPPQFFIDWKVEAGYRGLKENDSVHLRMHVLNIAHDIALADGDPPQNKPGNPKKLTYLLLHRKGDYLQSTFVSVIELYRSKSFIKQVKQLNKTNDGTVVLEIQKEDGTTDYIVSNPFENKEIKFGNSFSMKGNIGYVQQKKGMPQKLILVNGTQLGYGNVKLQSAGSFNGTIKKMNKELTGGGWLLTDTDLPTDGSLIGEQVIIKANSDRDAVYTIHNIQREGNMIRIDCGPINFIRDYNADKIKVRLSTVPETYSNGYLHDFDEGAAFSIKLHKEWIKK